jgi:hypothetical protein
MDHRTYTPKGISSQGYSEKTAPPLAPDFPESHKDGFALKESGVYGDMAVGSQSPTISTVENTSTAVLFCPLAGLTKK